MNSPDPNQVAQECERCFKKTEAICNVLVDVESIQGKQIYSKIAHLCHDCMEKVKEAHKTLTKE